MNSIPHFKLNPFANTFVPKKTKGKSIEDEAAKMVKDLFELKKLSGHMAFTKIELTSVVEKLIHLKYNVTPNIFWVKKYVSDKLPNGCVEECRTRRKNYVEFSFNMTIPKPSILLVSFFGLYRYKQSMCPTLSFTYRSDVLKNKIWSLRPEDKKLWNQFCAKSNCGCPPMFGYIIPPSFLGNPLGVSYSCSETNVHINHYDEVKDGEELRLLDKTNIRDQCENLDFPFDDTRYQVKTAHSLDFYTGRMKFIIKEVCQMIYSSDETASSLNEDSYTNSFWNDASNESNVYNPQDLDDDYHPLLERNLYDEESADEFEERIKSIFSGTDRLFLNREVKSCDPPCSVWCDSVARSEKTEQSKTVDMLEEMSNNKLINPLPENVCFPQQNNEKSKRYNTWFKRSFSVNDCDTNDSKKILWSNQLDENFKETLRFLKTDPINFFKTVDKDESWKDSDSGFASHWSSQEDIDSDNTDQQNVPPMWGLFGGKNNIWKSLPECLPNEPGASKKSHKRARDFKRQASLN